MPTALRLTKLTPGQIMAIRIGLFYGSIYVGTGASMTWMSVWFLQRGLSGPEIGVILAAPMLGRILVGPATAVWADGFKLRRTGLAILGLIGFVALALLGVTHGFWPALVCWFISAAATAAMSPLTDVIALRRGRQDGFAYAFARGIGSAAYIVGNVGGGLAVARLSPDSVLIWAMGAAALSVLGARLLLPAEPTDPAGSVQAGAARWRGVGELLRNPLFLLAIGSVGLIQAAHAFYYAFSTVLWIRQGVSSVVTGALWGVGVAAEILFFWLMEPLRRRLGPERLIILGGVGAVVRWTAFAFSPPLWLTFPLQTLHAASFSATFLGSLQLVERLTPPQHASAAQTLNSTVSSGVFIGLATIGSGWLYQGLGAQGYLVMAAMSALGLIGAIRLQRALAAQE